ncbi:cation:proton antiporter [Actinoallomurus purpureus]|nr:cation:proton antiporter [Actinoallomurus purpureus]
MAVALLGWLFAHSVSLGDLVHSRGYLYVATTLLAIGLYSSTYGIDRDEIKADARTVLLAVTFGVLVKATLIAVVMYAVFRRPEYLVLGVAVAQIDPLSVAAMQKRSRMSPRAKAVLLAWASFDDPVTMLLTIYISAFTLSILGAHGRSGPIADGTLSAFVTDLAANLLFAGVASVIWWLAGRWMNGRVKQGVQMAVLLMLAAFAVWQFLMLGLAIVGLFFRPRMGRHLGIVTQAAFVCAVFALGMLLPGIDIVPGLVLAAGAFGAQALVALLLARRHTANDRGYLAFGQQNGITAIILALLLQPAFPRTIGIVAPAIILVNMLHIACNAYWDARVTAASHRETESADRLSTPSRKTQASPS